MKNVVAVNTKDVCKMVKKTNYSVLDNELIENYIRKYISDIFFQENNIIKRIHNEFNIYNFYIEMGYDNTSLNLYEIKFDNDLITFDFVNKEENSPIFFNYKEYDLKLSFDLLVPAHCESDNLTKFVCLHQLIGNYTCKLANICTKYK